MYALAAFASSANSIDLVAETLCLSSDGICTKCPENLALWKLNEHNALTEIGREIHSVFVSNFRGNNTRGKDESS